MEKNDFVQASKNLARYSSENNFIKSINYVEIGCKIFCSNTHHV